MGGPAGVDYAEMTEGAEKGLTIKPSKIKRVWLASFLSAMAAVVVVALAGIVVLFATSAIGSVLGHEDFFGFGPDSRSAPILNGIFVSALAATLNWYLFFIVIPVATLVLGLSIGRFPKRRIVKSIAYFRWAAIWGAILVLAPCVLGLIITMDMANDLAGTIARFVSGSLAGILIGGVSGVAVGGIWLAIVWPARQIRDVDTSVFT